MRRLNLTGKSAATPAAVAEVGLPGLAGQSNLLSWAGTFGQGLTSLTKGKASDSPPALTEASFIGAKLVADF